MVYYQLDRVYYMSSRYQYRRVKRYQNKSKRNFIATIIIILVLLYVTFVWILPFLIGGVGFIKNFTNPSKKVVIPSDQTTLAPPVLNIPYEATNTAQIDIGGFASSGAKVELFLDDDKKQTVEVSVDGSFKFSDVALSLGTNNIYGKTLDEKNQESLPSKTLVIIFDNEKPNLDISEPEDNKIINGGEKKVKISGKTEAGVLVYVNSNQVIVDKDGNFTTTLDLNEGDNNFDIKAIDTANNSNEVSRKVVFHP